MTGTDPTGVGVDQEGRQPPQQQLAMNTHYPPEPAVATPQFQFDGGAGSFFLVSFGATLLHVITLGLALPWSVAMYDRWQTNHTLIGGRRLTFTGSGGSLFGHYLKWWLLTVVTLGIYSFWVWPRMVRCATEKQVFA